MIAISAESQLSTIPSSYVTLTCLIRGSYPAALGAHAASCSFPDQITGKKNLPDLHLFLLRFSFHKSDSLSPNPNSLYTVIS